MLVYVFVGFLVEIVVPPVKKNHFYLINMFLFNLFYKYTMMSLSLLHM